MNKAKLSFAQLSIMICIQFFISCAGGGGKSTEDNAGAEDQAANDTILSGQQPADQQQTLGQGQQQITVSDQTGSEESSQGSSDSTSGSAITGSTSNSSGNSTGTNSNTATNTNLNNSGNGDNGDNGDPGNNSPGDNSPDGGGGGNGNPATKIVIINPSDVTAGSNASITIEAQGADGSKDSTYNNNSDIELVCDGEASGCEGALAIANGSVTINVSNNKAETVNLSLNQINSIALDTSSTQDVIFNPGSAIKIVILDPTDTSAGGSSNVTLQALDSLNNKDSNFNNSVDFELLCSGSATGCGGALNFASGEVIVSVANNSAETVNLSINKINASALDTSSVQDLVFTGPADLVDDDNSATGFAGGTNTNRIAVNSDHITLASFSSESEREMLGNLDIIDPLGSKLAALYSFSGTASASITSGSTLADKSANGVNLTSSDSNGTMIYADSPFDVGVQFDGVNDQLKITDAETNDSLDVGTGDFSIGLWFKKTASPGSGLYQTLVGKDDGTANYYLELYSTNRAAFYVQGVGNTAEVKTSATVQAINTNTWYHLVAVRENNNLKIFLNGRLHETLGLGSLNLDNDGDFFIAGTGGNDPNWFQGVIDEVFVVKKALTGDEINHLYRRQSGTYAEGAVFQSRIMDIGTTDNALQTLNVTHYAPYGKNLPDSSAPESGYSAHAADASLLTGLVSLWHFDGTTGNSVSTATDSESAHHGTSSGSNLPVYSSSSALGTAAYFDGTDDRLTLAHHSDLNITGAFTFSAWLKTDSFPAANSYQYIYGKETGSAGYGFFIFGDGVIATYIGHGSGWLETKSSGKISLGRWTHVAGSWSDGSQKIYINGQSVSLGSGGSWSGFNPASTSGNAYIGDCCNDNAVVHHGYIDELALWNRNLTDAEVLSVFVRGNSIAYQVRACANADCSDAAFVGPSSSATAFFTVDKDNFTGVPAESFSLSGLGGRYFQYRAVLRALSPVAGALPRLESVELVP